MDDFKYKPEPESSAEHWKRTECNEDDPAKQYKLSINGVEIIADETFDNSRVKRETVKQISSLFQQVIIDTKKS